jgi:hypothetical protein
MLFIKYYLYIYNYVVKNILIAAITNDIMQRIRIRNTEQLI